MSNSLRDAARPTALRRVGEFLAVCAGILIVFFSLVRPWYQTWGATEQDLTRVLPGDDIVPTAAPQETRAITINAPMARVWPWVAQLGEDRGGFYSYDQLENLVGCTMPTSDALRPECQSWKLGDTLWMYPPEKARGLGFAILRVLEPGRALAFGTHSSFTPPVVENGSWAFVVEPVDSATTRFLVRGRGPVGVSPAFKVFSLLVYEPMHFVMERRTMIGVKQLAELGDRRRHVNTVQIVLWVIAFASMLFASVAVFRRPNWRAALLGVAVSAAVFQILTLGQPSLLIAIVLTAVPILFLGLVPLRRSGSAAYAKSG